MRVLSLQLGTSMQHRDERTTVLVGSKVDRYAWKPRNLARRLYGDNGDV